MSYHKFIGDDLQEFGSFEVFYMNEADADDWEGQELGAGWYWQACFPGCIPDGDPMGPFDTEQDAIDDAQGS